MMVYKLSSRLGEQLGSLRPVVRLIVWFPESRRRCERLSAEWRQLHRAPPSVWVVDSMVIVLNREACLRQIASA